MRGPYLEIQDHDARPVSTSRAWFQRRAGQLALALGVLCAVAASGIVFVYSKSNVLPLVYLLGCIVSFVLLYYSRRNLFSAIGIGTLSYVVGFLLSVPFLVAIPTLTRRMLSHSMLALSVGLSLLALVGYAVGCLGPFRGLFRPVFRWVTRTKAPLRPVTHAQFIVLAAWVVLAGVARVALGLEVAGVGELTVVPGLFAGIIGYSLRGGTLVLIGLFVYRAFDRGKLFILEGYILAGAYAVSELLLGWKSALMGPAFMFLTAYWYHAGRGGRRRSIIWVLALVALFPLTMSIGQAERAQILGTKSLGEYAQGPIDFLLKVVTRLDGNTRFVAVLSHEMTQGAPSWTNHFKFVSLIRSGITTTQYADVYVFGHDPRRATSSTGSSGPGGAYIGMGMLGILLGYLLLGAAVRCMHDLVESLREPSLAVALYSMLIFNLLTLFSGNFRAELMVKQFFLYFIIIVVAKRVLRGRPAFGIGVA